MTGNAIAVRAADVREIDQLAQLWFDGWRDAHQRIVPAELTRLRTIESFRDRLRAALATVRVIGPPRAPIGLYMLKGAELYQFYVSAPTRGTGVAAVLMADAERRLAESGVDVAWLACAIGNARAARFYEKCGWRRTAIIVTESETSEGPFDLPVWRYEKSLTR
jgi:GNAT superfamily N-acetyltransferase